MKFNKVKNFIATLICLMLVSDFYICSSVSRKRGRSEFDYSKSAVNASPTRTNSFSGKPSKTATRSFPVVKASPTRTNSFTGKSSVSSTSRLANANASPTRTNSFTRKTSGSPAARSFPVVNASPSRTNSFSGKPSAPTRTNSFSREPSGSPAAPTGRTQQTTTTLNVKNKWGRLAIGIMEGFLDNETGWYQCLPKKWVQEEADVAGDGFIQEYISNLGTIASTIANLTGKVLSAVCDLKGTLISFFVDFLGFMKEKFGSRFFLEGKFQVRRVTTRRDFSRFISEKKSKLKDMLASTHSHLREVIKSLSTHLVNFRNNIVKLLQSKEFQTFLTVAQCAYSIYSTVTSLQSMVTVLADQFISKLSSAVFTASGGFITIIIKVLYNLMCAYGSIGKFINLTVAAFKTNVTSDRFYYIGQAVGILVKIVLNAVMGLIKRR